LLPLLPVRPIAAARGASSRRWRGGLRRQLLHHSNIMVAGAAWLLMLHTAAGNGITGAAVAASPAPEAAADARAQAAAATVRCAAGDGCAHIAAAATVLGHETARVQCCISVQHESLHDCQDAG
jgi:hypothetical protein